LTAKKNPQTITNAGESDIPQRRTTVPKLVASGTLPGIMTGYLQLGCAMIDTKINSIREACTPLIGKTIECFETAEILHDDGTWDDRPDLPIRIYCTGNALISVSWSRFDDLWLSNDNSLPFVADVATTRWKPNGIEKITAAIGRTISGASLGRGEMSIESRDIEIGTRLVFDLGGA